MRNVLIGVLLVSAFSSLHGQWQFTLKKDEMTDEQRATFALRSTVQTRNSIGVATTPMLLLRCSGGRLTDLFISVDTYVGEQVTVQMRWDAGTPYEEVWSESTSRTALFAPEPDSLVDSLLSHHKLVFRFFPPGGNPQTTTFLLAPLAPQDAALRKYCGFTATRRVAEIAAEARRAARERKEGVLTIELAPAQDTISLAEGDVVIARTLVKSVRNGKGVALKTYELSFSIEYVNERQWAASFGDTLPLHSGSNNVAVFVNGTQAKRTLTNIVK